MRFPFFLSRKRGAPLALTAAGSIWRTLTLENGRLAPELHLK